MGNRLSVLSSLWLCVLGLVVGCVDYGDPRAANAQGGYKYITVTRDSSGRYIAGSPNDPGGVAFYQYGFRRSDLVKISPDLEVAIRQMIEARRGVPPECTSGFRVTKVIPEENGGVSANIECNTSPKSKAATSN